MITLLWLGIEPFILKALWGWYVVPMGIKPLTWLLAFGLNIVVNVIVYRSPWETFEEMQTASNERSYLTILGVLTAFAFGWVGHFWL